MSHRTKWSNEKYILYLQKRRSQLHSGESKFVQDGSYRVKTKDPIRDDWRSRKGFSKDQGKHGTWCKCGRYLKKVGNRQHRRWANKLLKSEKYDYIYYHQDMFVSSWDAC